MIVDGREAIISGSLARITAVVAPGRQWVIELKKLTCFIIESPIIAIVAGNRGSRVATDGRDRGDGNIGVALASVGGGGSARSGVGCAATWTLFTGGGALVIGDGGAVGTAGGGRWEEWVAPDCLTAAVSNILRRVEDETGSGRRPLLMWAEGGSMVVVGNLFLGIGDGGRWRGFPRPRPAIFHGGAGVELAGGGDMDSRAADSCVPRLASVATSKRIGTVSFSGSVRLRTAGAAGAASSNRIGTVSFSGPA